MVAIEGVLPTSASVVDGAVIALIVEAEVMTVVYDVVVMVT